MDVDVTFCAILAVFKVTSLSANRAVLRSRSSMQGGATVSLSLKCLITTKLIQTRR